MASLTPDVVAAPAGPAVVSTVGFGNQRTTDLLDRVKRMWTLRDPFLPYWQELADVLLPTQATFTQNRQRAAQLGEGIYDGTPRLALRDLATSIDGLIKPKTSQWFDLTVDDEALAEQDDVKRWLENTRERMWNAIYRKNARFIQRSGEVDLNLACFGWGVLWLQENRNRNGLLFRSFHLSQCAIGEGEDGVIDSIAVEEMMTPQQAADLYRRANKTVSPELDKRVRDPKLCNERNMRFVQIVLPQYDRLGDGLGPRGMPFASAVIDVTFATIVAETGFVEFPAAVPRWETSPGEVYPRSPGMMALPDARTLQAMGKTLLIGGQRAVDPPIWVSNDSIFSPLRTFPGGVTVLDTSEGGTPVGAFPVATNIPVGREMQRDYRSMVETAFFKNVFRLPVDGPSMTAYEVAQRKQEFIRIMGPVFGRLETDYIGHIAERAFGIMDRANAFLPRPLSMQESQVPVTFRFQSPIQQVRKQIEVASMGQALAQLAPLAQAQPDIFDNFDGDQIARDAPEWSGMPTKWIKPLKDRDGQRAQRQQQSSVAATIAAAKPVSGAIKDLAVAGAQTQDQGIMGQAPRP